MKDWSWDIIEKFFKRTSLTTKILKVIVLNLVYYIYIFLVVEQIWTNHLTFFFIKDKNRKLFKALIKKKLNRFPSTKQKIK